ncbi:MAG: histidine triad nucleotide-binding protein [Pseudomonadota bacterium]|nr:histidine triad nucleotide-binding protein [Pseudomonadota bacterium]
MTLFEKIIARQIPADIVYEDAHTIAFRDINPQAPTHVLVVPRQVIPRLDLAEEADVEVLGRTMLAAGKVARQLGLTGYRVVINNGEEVGQTVFHLHLHILGGRRMGWPPG